jgi:hypothetical protein
MRILVCGGRDFDDWKTFCWAMAPFVNCDTIIQGGARGADTMAQEWAGWHERDIEHYHADWDKHGKAAGPIRNKQMLEEGDPDLVVAFPGGAGTRNMVEQARKAGVEVIEIEDISSSS